uniref:V-myb avian myeloblastosis viral oncogene homolog-like 1 n=1 Tax=Acanthochromis polyacanthus TaxID=80966 RepID=A0A3Q1FGA0_9TELE
FTLCVFSNDEDEELYSTDPESKEKSKDKKTLCKVKWSRDEVIDLVHKYGPKRWSVIAKHLQGRIGKQCRERWHNHLNPEVKKSSWTQEEDRIIYEAHKRRRERGEASPLCDRTCSSFLDNISNSPKKTPTKSLPFTPSRFCNVSGAEHLNLDNPALTSTPVCGQRCLLNTPLQKETTPKHQKENDGSRTPKFRKTIMIPTPRTPTPFKNALAAQEKMHGPLKMEPQPLAFLEEDIREVLKQETGTDIFNRADVQPDYRAWKQNMDGPARKVRKSLVLDPWEKDSLNEQLFQEQLNDAQVSHSDITSTYSSDPTGIRKYIKDSLTTVKEESSLGVSIHPQRFTSPRVKKLPSSHKAEWEAVVYGKTEDQLIMTEQARQYLNPYPSSGSTSRALVL